MWGGVVFCVKVLEVLLWGFVFMRVFGGVCRGFERCLGVLHRFCTCLANNRFKFYTSNLEGWVKICLFGGALGWYLGGLARAYYNSYLFFIYIFLFI